MKYVQLLIVLVLICASCKKEVATENQIRSGIEKNRKGITLLKKALENHGDLKDPELQLAVQIVADKGVHRGQSLVADPPFERYKLETEFYIDRPNDLEIAVFKNRFAGFAFINTLIADADSVVGYEHNTRTFYTANSVGFNEHQYLPNNYLITAIKSPLTVSYDSKYVDNGTSYHQISTNFNGSKRWLSINAETGLLSKVETLHNYQPYGDGVRTIRFHDYFKVAKLRLPSRITSGGNYGAWNNSENDFRLTTGALVDHEVKGHESMHDYRKSDYSYRRNSETRQLAKDIYVIENITDSRRQWSYNILFIELDDSVLVAEAPVNNDISKEAIEKIKETIPKKPIKYLVQSHHHNDHWGGIREYMSLGSTIITSPGNENLLKAISKAPFDLNPDNQFRNKTTPAIKMVEGSFTLETKNREIQIYDIGPTTHANEMLVIYLPDEKILWQADMLNVGEWPLNNELKKQLFTKIDELNLDVKTIVGLHGRILQGEALDKLKAGIQE